MSVSGRPTAVGTYIFAGGFTLGVSERFNVLCHLEDGGYGVAAARANLPDLPIHVDSKTWPIEALRARGVNLVYANPPCAIFSGMGITLHRGKDAWRTDPRTGCWYSAFSLLERLEPGFWACESVPQVYTTGREMIDEMTRRALAQGYSVTHLFVDAQWTGLPQARRRFFLLCHRAPRLAGASFNWAPAPTIGEVFTGLDAHALDAERAALSPTLAGVIRRTPPGKGLRRTWEGLNTDKTAWVRNAQGHVVGRPSFQERRLRLDAPMGAFTGDKSWHPTEDRRLTVAEMRAICGYPADFYMTGNAGAQASLLARAVMPPVGRWLAGVAEATLRTSASGDPDARRVTLIDLRRPGGPDPVDLTDEYLDDDGLIRPQVRPPNDKDARSPDDKDARSTKRARAPVAPLTTVLDDDAPAPAKGEGSGRFIRRLWMLDRYTPDQLVALVHHHYANRRTRRSDVYYNYRLLLDGGANPPPWSLGPRGGRPATIEDETAVPTRAACGPEDARKSGGTGAETRFTVTGVNALARWIGERQRIQHRRERGDPRPWTSDPVLAGHRFCCVRREDDRVSRYILDRWLPGVAQKHLAYAALLARLVNREDALDALRAGRRRPITGAEALAHPGPLLNPRAYGVRGTIAAWLAPPPIVDPDRRAGFVRALFDGLLAAVHAHRNAIARALGRAQTVKAAQAALGVTRGVGPFLSAQIAMDLDAVDRIHGGRALDAVDFCDAGPGSVRGLRRVMTERLPSADFVGVVGELRDLLNATTEFSLILRSRDVEHALCEFDKYERLRESGGRRGPPKYRPVTGDEDE